MKYSSMKVFELKIALIMLFNGIKKNQHISEYLTLSNVTTILKNKGWRLNFDNETGMVSSTVGKKILDKLSYVDKYSEIENNMSDSNFGSIKDHLLIIHGVINSVINGNEECIDIQIYDLMIAFDALWLHRRLSK